MVAKQHHGQSGCDLDLSAWREGRRGTLGRCTVGTFPSLQLGEPVGSMVSTGPEQLLVRARI